MPANLANHLSPDVLRAVGAGRLDAAAAAEVFAHLDNNKLMDRPEVLKVVNPQFLGQAGAAERFLREIRSAARLGHPNIVTAYSALQAGELLVFAMEYVEGETLEHFVQARGRLP